MTVYRPKGGRTYRYDFQFHGQRYFGSTGQLTLRDAQEWEWGERVRLARQAGQLALRAHETPRIQDWAETFYAHKAATLKRPDLLKRDIMVVLEFAGGRPRTPPAPPRPGAPPRRKVPVEAPYHDLRLGDFVEHPEWIVAFETWMRARQTGGSARNHYRSVLSGMYKVAMLPQYRRATGIQTNPFQAIERDRPRRRRVTQSVPELRRWIAAAAPHIRLALAIGALAHKLRLSNILTLRWDRNVDADLTYLTVHDHKADDVNPEPLVVPISAQLRGILAHARMNRGPRDAPWIIQFRGRRVQAIKKGLKAAAARAKVPYGVKAGGATFHTLRHTMSTLLAELGVAEIHRKEAAGHSDIATTQLYTHLRPEHLRPTIELLSAAVPLEDVFGESAGPSSADPPKTAKKRPRRPQGSAATDRQKRQETSKRTGARHRAS